MTRCYIIYVLTLRCILLYSDSKLLLFLFGLLVWFAGLLVSVPPGRLAQLALGCWLIAGAEIQQHAFLAEEFRRHKMLRKLFIGKIQCF